MCRAFGAIITAVILIPAIGPAAAIHDVMDRLPRIGGTGYPNPGHECGGLNICLEGCESGGTCFDSGDGSAWVCTGAPYPASGCVMSGAEICGTNSLLVAHGENNNAFW
ncbi:MAG TPA: hypothetical protein VHH36_05885, partial [Candidatus Thermoplasmatota archaeon]|nr:hypothetical protein [Candidatus Thermoplasmatota archaeon]